MTIGEEPHPTATLPAANSDRCASCGAQLAVDQRYCVECGARRGQARFTLAGGDAQGGSTPQGPPKKKPFFKELSSSATLLAGIATLLLAMGVGFLIGNHNSSTPQNPKPANVVINGAGGGGSQTNSAAATPTQTTASANTQTTSSHANKSKPKRHAKAKAKKAKTAAAPKTIIKITTKTNPANAVNVKQAGVPKQSSGVSQGVGTKCQAGGFGCKNGKQTDNLF